MKILIACEESQTVCKAFRQLGDEAYSCDVLPCSGGHPEWHLQQDVLPLLREPWDLIIAHPPCTFLTVTGNRWFNVERYGEAAIRRERERERELSPSSCRSRRQPATTLPSRTPWALCLQDGESRTKLSTHSNLATHTRKGPAFGFVVFLCSIPPTSWSLYHVSSTQAERRCRSGTQTLGTCLQTSGRGYAPRPSTASPTQWLSNGIII